MASVEIDFAYKKCVSILQWISASITITKETLSRFGNLLRSYCVLGEALRQCLQIKCNEPLH
jgi:hypothetical protein